MNVIKHKFGWNIYDATDWTGDRVTLFLDTEKKLRAADVSDGSITARKNSCYWEKLERLGQRIIAEAEGEQPLEDEIKTLKQENTRLRTLIYGLTVEFERIQQAAKTAKSMAQYRLDKGPDKSEPGA